MNRFAIAPPRFLALALLLALLALPGGAALAQAARIKDVAAVQGVRSNQLTGYGLVVGLDGTGDQSSQMPYTSQTLANYLQQMGITLPPGANLQPKNVAAVLVTAQLPAFARPGQAIDVTVSSAGNAKSLRGGTLITTPLRGVDGQVYALAQGNLLVGGAGASAGGSSVTINHLSAGRIPGGGQVERAVPTPFLLGEHIDLNLNAADFQTARRVAQSINRALGEGMAQALDGRMVRVRAPLDPNARVAFVADIEDLPLDLPRAAAKVVVNARTGSVVMNQSVALSPSAVAHGNLSVSISSTPQVSQPGPFAPPGAQTVVTEKADIQVSQQGGALIQMAASAQLGDVVKALNALGATPQDLVAILQALKAAGALQAELEVI
ncbi:flagellar basal body P-ring protein FlgI [Aquabacterium sp. A08]|uniref:flagellar basal body P-ring protein FlgI n=1 Tax=Aquabacterium sp. A08 TaxID=2718532 RepID=UPI0014214CA9|nr:flagellar basal body P-ring protein FlgI [Aquabacterium sp. A08]NIC40214.1 flagellar basal body P-ring protein FlgI [Aquabacterium sp. A08]